MKGNDVWAFVLMDYIPQVNLIATPQSNQPQEVTDLLQSYQDVFIDPK
jgi:hypothetical protein